MTAKWRCRTVLLTGLLTAVLAGGCNPLQLPFFLFAPEPKIEASLKRLAAKDKDKTVRVVVLVSHDLNKVSADFIGADRALANLVASTLREQCKANKEKVEVVPTTKVEEFKNKHPDTWRTMPLDEIGRRFDADYVIDLELTHLSLHEPKSSGFYRGRAQVSITLMDVNEPDEPISDEFNWNFPGDVTQGIPVEDTTLPAFRLAFYKSLATQLAWHFTGHTTADDFRERR
jgi:hypothetical protein